ncbi:hypothetical protein L3N51_00381 [Metallosphaera sp. J1]|uniref:hypothetical protein n=1 Tax=Metallosphaera javensis (ex Hofmann et al. 2022) TaxID=99938 RepID=UPI001EDFD20A|nr:hypothetical protein [Metallosphaera javensis (ex Hofmann et al. 2022)]MCG3108100.1 hypothetical protein [Metallosphaera javensis (ex Hofmann et al. 2022)]
MRFPEGSLVSFFTSGFPSHVKVSAVDVGSYDREDFISFFRGIVLSVERFKVGRPNRYAETDHDYLVVVKSGSKLLKVLHVAPYLEPGEEIKPGEALGKMISSPYTGGDFRHAHIEGLRFTFPEIETSDERGIGQVVKTSENFIDVRLSTYSIAGDFRGLGCCGGLLNASLPFAGYGGLIGTRQRGVIMVGGKKYSVARTRRNLSIFESRKGLVKNWEYDSAFKVMANRPVDGPPLLESILSFRGRPVVRIFGKMDLKEGDEVDVWAIIGDHMG